MPAKINRIPPPPWRVDPNDPGRVLCADGNLIATAALWPGAHPTDRDLALSARIRTETAGAIAAFPDLLDAIAALRDAWTCAFPQWKGTDIAEATSEDLVVAAHRLWAVTNLMVGLNADGSIPGAPD